VFGFSRDGACLPAPTPTCGLCHDGLLHDFVLVPVGVTIREAGSTDLLGEADKTSHFRDRTGANGVIVPDRPIPSGGTPNQMLTFRPCPRKLPETQETDRTEQAP
jgi:hypothetical protein